MDLSTIQVLITGGSEGIGLGLASRFLQAGSRVLITGRNVDKLKAAAEKYPGLEIFVNDIGSSEQREVLAKYVQEVMPGINLLVNNAGIQRRIALASDNAPWNERQQEIDILLAAPIHLNHLLIPLLIANGKASTIVNVTSGGAYVPQVFAPVYSACKAALHSYTMVLRHSLKETGCRVVELIPPAVQTSLAGAGQNHGAPLDEFCDTVFEKLINTDAGEIGYGPTDGLKVSLSGKSQEEMFEASAGRFPVAGYEQK
ncbi:SDR family oxidoreductase [Chitinophaga sp. Cy-1792]|uniref:SDR family oxidoreductase n=1 Tax=Chitinophaga sp. Cy-1792 TaxID=2608339 RepID=UPI001422E64E|nr:SDR family NAD(P)-dependent oxidoreductase [Chitinophaga sp. Cy-1792]NIG53674.1 SDR family NAD(P)-dependent oxidoreductase [Chitinophaga sp. Cy-1792]